MHDINKLLNQTQVKINELITENNEKARENHIGREISCTAYRSYVLTTITSSLGNTEKGKLPNLINDEQLAKWWYPQSTTEIVVYWQQS